MKGSADYPSEIRYAPHWHELHGAGADFRNVLIIGSKERAKDVITIIGDQLGAGFKVVGCLEVDSADIGKTKEKPLPTPLTSCEIYSA